MTGAYIFGCQGLELSAAEAAFFRDADPFGFILFARNLETPDQIRALTADLRDAVGRDAPILIDQEGGRVARLRPPDWLGWMPPLEQMASTRAGQGARAMWLRYRLIADELRALGIDTNCAPIADVPGPGVHAIIRDRCYGGDVDTIAAAGRAVADGLLAGGVLPVLKHIPGHGRPGVDSHIELPRTDASLDDLMTVDFEAFRRLADLPMGMTAHVVYEALDAQNCATQSPDVIAVIRNEIGFGGLLMSDDLSMHALQGSFAERTWRSLDAGCDVILHCHGDPGEMAEIAAEAGAMRAFSARRAAAALSCRQVPGEIDRTALLAELDGLIMLARDEQRHDN